MILAEEAPETEMVAETETEPETEEVFSEEKIMFVLDTLKVHEGPSAESKTIAYSDLGSSVSVLGQLGDWYHVRLDDPYEKAQEQEAQEPEAQEAEPNPKPGSPKPKSRRRPAMIRAWAP